MRRLLIALFCAFLIAAPGLALARAGSSSSMGSRGSQTYSAPAPTSSAPYGAAPMQQSATPYGSTQPGYGQSQRSPMGGFLGGMLTGGLIGMMFGGGLFRHGIFGLFGGVFQLLILFWLVRWLFGMFFRGGGRAAPMMSAAAPGAMAGAGPGTGPLHQLALTPGDYQIFEQTLYAVQQAWSQHDINTLRLIATPEMVSYFGEQMAEQSSRGVRNLVSDVHLDKGDLSEAWSEAGRDYATVSMHFSMIDVTYDQAGHVVSGTPGQRVAATEFWTFLRMPGGRWVLSAIQQAQ